MIRVTSREILDVEDLHDGPAGNKSPGAGMNPSHAPRRGVAMVHALHRALSDLPHNQALTGGQRDRARVQGARCSSVEVRRRRSSDRVWQRKKCGSGQSVSAPQGACVSAAHRELGRAINSGGVRGGSHNGDSNVC